MRGSRAAGISIPTVLSLGAAVSGMGSLGTLVLSAALWTIASGDQIFAQIAGMLGLVLGLVALALLGKAFRERERLIAVRHVNELVEMLREVPLAVVAAETGRSAIEARALVVDAMTRGEVRGSFVDGVLRSQGLTLLSDLASR